MKNHVLRIHLACLFMLSISFTSVAAAELQTIKEAELRRVVTEYLQQKTASLGVEIRLKKLGYSGDVTLNRGTVDYEFIGPQDWEGWGKASIALIIRVNDQVEKNLPLNLEVEALADVVVTTRQLEIGDIVDKKDIAMQKRDISTVSSKVSRNPEDAVGKRVRVGMRSNSPVRSDYIEKRQVIKSGQVVTIIAENSAFRVTATGRARSNGAVGDTVMVQNTSALKDVPAVVVDSNTVRVDF